MFLVRRIPFSSQGPSSYFLPATQYLASARQIRPLVSALPSASTVRSSKLIETLKKHGWSLHSQQSMGSLLVYPDGRELVIPRSCDEQQLGVTIDNLCDSSRRGGKHSQWETPFVLNSLLRALCRQDDLQGGETVLNVLMRSYDGFVLPISYCALIQAHSNQGKLSNALELFKQYLERARQNDKVASSMPVSAIITALTKAGKLDGAFRALETASQVFEEHNLILHADAYDALINSCLASNEPHRGMLVYRHMHQQDLKPTNRVLASTVGCLGALGDYQAAIQLVEATESEGVELNEAPYNALIAACAACGRPELGMKVYNHAVMRGIPLTQTSLASAIKTLGEAGKLQQAVNLLTEVYRTRPMGLQLTSHPFHALMAACVRASRPALGALVYEQMIAIGVPHDSSAHNAYINCLARSGRFSQVLEILAEGRAQSPHEYTGYIAAAMKCKQPQRGHHIYKQMLQHGVAPTNDVLAACVKSLGACRQIELAMEVIRDAANMGLKLSSRPFCSLMSACIKLGRPNLVVSMYSQMLSAGVPSDNEVVEVVISALAALRDLNSAVMVLDNAEVAGVKLGPNSYACLIAACVKCNQPENGVLVYDRMLSQDLKPTGVVLASCVISLGAASQIDHAFQLVQEAEESGTMALGPNVYESLINACCRTGVPERSLEVYQKVLERSAKYRSIVLAACITSLASANQLETALGLLEQAAYQSSPTCSQPYTAAIHACISCGQPVRATGVWEQMVAEGIPATNNVLAAMAMSMAVRGDHEEAMGLLQVEQQRGLQVNSTPFVHLMARQDGEDELDWGNRVTLLYDTMREMEVVVDTHVLNYRVSSLTTLGNFPAALAALEEAQQAGYLSPMPYFSLIKACTAVQRPQLATQVYQHMREAGVPLDPEFLACCIDALALTDGADLTQEMNWDIQELLDQHAAVATAFAFRHLRAGELQEAGQLMSRCEHLHGDPSVEAMRLAWQCATQQHIGPLTTQSSKHLSQMVDTLFHYYSLSCTSSRISPSKFSLQETPLLVSAFKGAVEYVMREGAMDMTLTHSLRDEIKKNVQKLRSNCPEWLLPTHIDSSDS